MAYYVPKYNGYIADVADMDFIRNDGTPFSFKEATATSVSQSADNLTINGGWSIYPLAYIDSGRSLELTFTSAQFTMEMFELANNTTSTSKDYGVYESDLFSVVSSGEPAALTVTLPFEAQAATIKIRGLEYVAGTTPSTGKFVVANNAGNPSATPPTATTTVITFASGDVLAGDEIRVTYKRRVSSAEVLTVRTDTTTARGEMTLHWPIYSSGGDTDHSTIKGYVHMHIPTARVTALPGFDTSLAA